MTLNKKLKVTKIFCDFIDLSYIRFSEINKYWNQQTSLTENRTETWMERWTHAHNQLYGLRCSATTEWHAPALYADYGHVYNSTHSLTWPSTKAGATRQCDEIYAKLRNSKWLFFCGSIFPGIAVTTKTQNKLASCFIKIKMTLKR